MPIPEYLVEFTCISNTLGGLLLITDGILNLNGKSVPSVFYRNISVGIFFVFAICMGSLSGAYLLFDYILGNIRGSFVYGFFVPSEISIAGVLIIGVVFYIMMCAVGAFFLFLNKCVIKLKSV